LDGLAEALGARREKIAVVDHHATADDVGALQWLDTTAAAAGVMVVELIDAVDWAIDARAAEALLVAMTSDTGWFRFANTDGRCLRAAGRLFDAGVRADVLYRRLYQSDRPERLRLMARVLAGLELHCGGRLAVMALRRRDLAETGARPDETENLVNEALRIGSVESAVILIESPENDEVRVSLRSRNAVDVAAVARCFGGGGHARAAGLRVSVDLDELKRRLVDAFAERLGEARGE
jgi:phosphoesterase RecJ-like protein